MMPFKVAIIIMMMGSSMPPVQMENINNPVNFSAPAVVDIKKAIIDKEIAPVALEEKKIETAPAPLEKTKGAIVIENDAEDATVDGIVRNNSTPEAVCSWISKKVIYRTDIETWGTSGHWQTSEETLRLGASDCKGFAILIYECLKKLNLEDVKMVVLTSRHYGHAVVIFKKDGKWRMVSNGKLYSYIVEDYKDLFKVFVGYGNYQFCTPEDHNILKV